MSKFNYDYAAEMLKIAASQDHQDQMEKLAFSRDGKVEPSEVEEELKKLASDDKDCKCEDCKEDCDCECHEGKDKSEKKEASDISIQDAASVLLDLSTELEDAGHERLAAASISLAEMMIKEAKDKSKDKSSASKSSGKSSDKSSGKSSDKSSGKKMSLKERMEKMRAMQGKGKKKKDEKKKVVAQQAPNQYVVTPEVWAAQSALTNLAKQTGNKAFNPGTIDGKLGPNTMAALRAYKGKSALNAEEVEEAIQNLTSPKGFQQPG